MFKDEKEDKKFKIHLKPDGMTSPTNALRCFVIRYDTFSRQTVKKCIKIYSIYKNIFSVNSITIQKHWLSLKVYFKSDVFNFTLLVFLIVHVIQTNQNQPEKQ